VHLSTGKSRIVRASFDLEPRTRAADLVGMRFYELASGARFEYHGKVYVKTAMDVAQDATGWDGMFRREGRDVPARLGGQFGWRAVQTAGLRDHITPAPGHSPNPAP
jgi:hypothetical protein